MTLNLPLKIIKQTGTRSRSTLTPTHQFQRDIAPPFDWNSLHDKLSTATHPVICHCDSVPYNIIQKHTWILMRIPLTSYCWTHWWTLIENGVWFGVEPGLDPWQGGKERCEECKNLHFVKTGVRRETLRLRLYLCVCLLTACFPTTRTGCVLILMAPPSPRLACNNEDSTFNNLDGQIKKRIQ